MTRAATSHARRVRDERRAEFRRRLSETLEKLLADDSFIDITIDRIIAEARTSRSTLYSHFPDKASLLLALADDVVHEAVDVAAPWWSLPPDATRDELEQAIGAVFDLYLDHRHTMRALVEASSYEPVVRARFGSMLDGSRHELEEHIRRGQAAGRVRASIEPHETAGWLIWMLERGLFQLVCGAADEDHRSRLLRSATDIIWYSLYRSDDQRRQQ